MWQIIAMNPLEDMSSPHSLTRSTNTSHVHTVCQALWEISAQNLQGHPQPTVTHGSQRQGAIHRRKFYLQAFKRICMQN